MNAKFDRIERSQYHDHGMETVRVIRFSGTVSKIIHAYLSCIGVADDEELHHSEQMAMVEEQNEDHCCYQSNCCYQKSRLQAKVWDCAAKAGSWNPSKGYESRRMGQQHCSFRHHLY
jgi:hypothetical protein